jgi:hypothetical protein
MSAVAGSLEGIADPQPEPPDLNLELLRRLRRAAYEQTAVARSLWADLQAHQMDFTRLHGVVADRRRRLEAWPSDPVPAARSSGEWEAERAEMENIRGQRRRAFLAQLRAQSASAAQIERAMLDFDAGNSKPARVDFEASLAEAEAAVRRAEDRERTLIDAQAAAAQRGGSLKATVAAAEAWLIERGYAHLVQEAA